MTPEPTREKFGGTCSRCNHYRDEHQKVDGVWLRCECEIVEARGSRGCDCPLYAPALQEPVPAAQGECERDCKHIAPVLADLHEQIGDLGKLVEVKCAALEAAREEIENVIADRNRVVTVRNAEKVKLLDQIAALRAALEDGTNSLTEMRHVAAKLCRIIFDCGFTDLLPEGFDGFGVRATNAIGKARAALSAQPTGEGS